MTNESKSKQLAEKMAELEAKKAAAIEAAKAKAEENAAKKAEKMAELEAKKAAAKIKNEMPIQNDIRRPKLNTQCGRIWQIADETSEAKNGPALYSEVYGVAGMEGINEATVRTQYARWRKFYGISGRIEPPKAPVIQPEQTPA
jgi:hypothetical protein